MNILSYMLPNETQATSTWYANTHKLYDVQFMSYTAYIK